MFDERLDGVDWNIKLKVAQWAKKRGVSIGDVLDDIERELSRQENPENLAFGVRLARYMGGQ
jgi:hypothetical protein